ncbi:NAD(P)H-hydrate dehydratase [bacterium]|nr:NAD(P)H-hydrate dehydratase [bacterium]
MSLPILDIAQVMAVEGEMIARGTPLDLLIERAVLGCSLWLKKNFPFASFQTLGVLVGSGHNGADALGIASQLLDEGREVTAVLATKEDSLKPATLQALKAFKKRNGRIHFAKSEDFKSAQVTSTPLWSEPSFWLDGLHGIGLNRPLAGLSKSIVECVQHQKKPIVAIDLPSGLQGDLGHFQRPDATSITANHTLALGCLKPAHVLDSCLESVGKLHFIPLGFDEIIAESSSAACMALTEEDLSGLLKGAKRATASHKFKNGRVLLVAGSEKYPGAAVMTCMGAGVSGAGMIHALVPAEARQAILNHVPEVIFESKLPDLTSFDAIVLGPGWVPADKQIFESIIKHVTQNENCFAVLDAGVFELLARSFGNGITLGERFIITPHAGEFARLFPGISADLNSGKINSIEAAQQAARSCKATVFAKGARSCIARPDGSADVIMESSSVLAHAGQGDVLAGLLGGLLARTRKTKSAARLAALLQSQTAVQFSERFPAALTLPPGELVRQLQHLRLH